MPKISAVLSTTLAVALAGATGCASGGQSASSSSTVSSEATQRLGPALLQWTGRFQPTQQQTGDGIGIRSRDRTTGSVKLVAAAESRIRATIDVSTSLTTPTNVRWAVASGACGSGSVAILPVNEFPEINVSSNGRGQLSSDVPAALPTAGTFHVNLYWTDGHDESDVMTCANLRLEERR